MKGNAQRIQFYTRKLKEWMTIPDRERRSRRYERLRAYEKGMRARF